MHPSFVERAPAPDCAVYTGTLEPAYVPDAARFEALWELRPEAFHEVVFGGVKRRTPRWQQAFGRDYTFAGSVNRAHPIPTLLEPLLAWGQGAVDARLNGLLVNWYDWSCITASDATKIRRRSSFPNARSSRCRSERLGPF